MAGNGRFEYTSASPDSGFTGSYQSGQRGYSAPTLDRSTSFRDGTENRTLTSAKANSRGSVNTSSGDVTALSQCLILDPIPIGDKKYGRSNDLRRVLGFSVGKGLEESSFSGPNLKSSSPVAVEELKRLRASVADTCVKASGRAKKFDDHLNKLNKYCESMSSKKQQQRSEMAANERSSGPALKIGSVMHRNPSEFGSQKLEDRPKDVSLNKRLRTSMVENRAECRNNGVLRQPLMGTKERDMLKDSNADCDMVDEKIRRLPAGGEGWDKKMKRKRSVGAVFSRTVDNDGELKRTLHHKLSSESSMQPSDTTHGFRSGASGGSNKLDPASSPAGPNARTPFRNEQEKSMLSRDLSSAPIKERTLGKVNVRINNREDNDNTCPSPIVKRTASRAPRSGSMVAANSASNAPRVVPATTLESWEQPQSVNKTPPIAVANNRKRSMPAGSSSPPITTQWVGQRPQKISRTRRTNLIPVSNHDDVPMQSDVSSPSDFGQRLVNGGTNASLPLKGSASGKQNCNIKPENVPSPARLSESEESGENRVKEKGLATGDMEEKASSSGQHIGFSAIPIKKNKIMVKEEIGDGVRRQGRSGRVSPFSRASVSPTRDKLENVAPHKPMRNVRSGYDKNGSKSGRPLKKLSDRKGFSRLGHVANGGSPDCSGESEDDREELLLAANLAWKSISSACSSSFWKTVEPLFANIGPDEKSYLSEQLKLAEETLATSYGNSSDDSNIQVKLDEYAHEEFAGPDSISSERYRCKDDTVSRNSSNGIEVFEQLQKERDIVPTLHQRLLSALIVEEEECEETGFGRPRSSVNNMDFCEPIYGVQTQKNNGNGHMIFSCNGNDFDKSPSGQDRLCNGEVEVLVRFSRCDYVPQTNNCGVSSFDCQYDQMPFNDRLVLELQSIGMFLEAVPALDDKEDEPINQDIVQLERGLHEQTGTKKTCLDKIHKAIQEGKDTARRDPEQVAMSKLVELAYKKLLATRGVSASKQGIPKILKPVALAFVKRTLARCHKFEDSGASCFTEPALRDIIFSPPPRFDETELLDGPLSNRAKRKDPSLDGVVGGAVFRASSALGLSGGAKGKRTERDRDSTKNTIAKAGRSSMGSSKGERKAKSKPKQKTAQLSNTTNSIYPLGNGGGSGDLENKSGNRRKDVRFMSSSFGNVPPVETKEFTDLPLNDDIDSLGLGVDSEIEPSQDLNSWFNFEVDGVQDHDSIGLEIPMDDLAELNMF